MPHQVRKKKRTIASSLALLVALLLVWQLGPKTVAWNQERLAAQLAAQIPSSKRPEILLRQLAGLGPVAIPYLVEAASSPPAESAARAQLFLSEQLELWTLLARTNAQFDFSSRALALAQALSRRIDRFDAYGKQWAEDLTIRLIASSRTLSAETAAQILERSTETLDLIPPLKLPPRKSRTATLRLPNVRPPTQVANATLAPQDVHQKQVANPPESNGAQPLQAEKTNKSNRLNAPELAIIAPSPPASSPGSDWSPHWNRTPDKTPTAKAMPLVAKPVRPKQTVVSTEQPQPNVSVGPDIEEVPSPVEVEQRLQRLRRQTTQNLFRSLAQGSKSDAGPVRSVLLERGIHEEEIDLARRFYSDDEQHRAQLFEKLSTVPAVTARRWLHLLLEDPAADIRLRALTAIATTTDPELLRVARRMAITDQDDRVVQLATQILERRDAGRDRQLR